MCRGYQGVCYCVSGIILGVILVFAVAGILNRLVKSRRARYEANRPIVRPGVRHSETPLFRLVNPTYQGAVEV